MSEYILKMQGICKSFSGVAALENVDLEVHEGTVHALLGENGAGKSTLMKILLGIYHADSGTITYKGKTYSNFSDPREALNLGISMIHQELSPVLDMRICDNIFLGREPVSKGLVNDKQLVADTEQLLDSLQIKGLNPKSKMRSLSVAQTQMVEIAKAVSFNSSLIIMDEPTSALSETEVNILFDIINKLRSRGISIIYISHKMEEIFRITDEITVFRDGKNAGKGKSSEMTKDNLFAMMVARDLSNYYIKTEHPIGAPVLEVKNLVVPGSVNDVSFELKKGEILGFAGLIGAGRTEIVEAIFGVRKKSSGTILINGQEQDIRSPMDAIQSGIALATEDRKQYGLFLDLSVKQNVCICSLKELCNMLGFVSKKDEKSLTSRMVKDLNVKTSSNEQLLHNLSGGNQQKVVLAKWICTNPDILILDEPTRGIDIGAKAEIYSIMDQLTQAGKSILMISSEMPEIIGMSDRVLVISGGRITAELSGETITQENIIKHATC